MSASSWRPPDGFVEVDSALAGISVYAPAPPPDDVAPPPDLRCERCGAPAAYAPGEHALVCSACASKSTIGATNVSVEEGKAEFRVATLDEMKRGWGASRTEVHCEGCGATVVVEARAQVTECSFCLSTHIVAQGASQEQLRPSSVLPFVVDEAGAREVISGWLREGKYQPVGLPRAIQSLHLQGVYLPWWVFGSTIRVQWHCEVKVTRGSGDNRQTYWEPRSGTERIGVSGDLEPAVNDLDERLVDQLYPFPLAQAVDFAPEYMAGFQTRGPTVNLPVAFARARHRWRDQAHAAAQSKLAGQSHRNFTSEITYEGERWQYVLLPVYIGRYRFKDDWFDVMVHGTDARVVGHKPLDARAFQKRAALLLAPGAALWTAGQILQEGFSRHTSLSTWGLIVSAGVGLYLYLDWQQAKKAGGPS